MEERTYSSPPAPARFVSLTPLSTLLESRRGTLLPLPRRLARLYGRLRMPMPRSRPHIFSNFVSTLDGVVSLGVTGHAGGGDISGFSAQDRMVMGLLRAIADVVIIGSGTLGVDNQDVWTAEAIFPALADDFRELRERLGKAGPPMNVIVSGNGAIDLRLPIFTSGKVPVLIVTTTKGASNLTVQDVPDSIQIAVIDTRADKIPARAILDAVTSASKGRLLLVEGGPRLLGDFYAEHLLDEQFLTLAPQVVGRESHDQRLSLVMGKTFGPGDGCWGTLTDVRRGHGHLFLRYTFTAPFTAPFTAR